jgi:predicted NUDIX family NTP pyrophosphohydrolase
MELSSGIILYKKDNNNEVKFFVCTPGGPYWENKELWNFPKGHVEVGESDFECALREFEEETSIKLNPNSYYIDFGLVRQNKQKNVHVYAKKYENEDTSNCYSNLCTSIINGISIEHYEIKGYAWKTIDELRNNGIKCYIPIFKKIIDNG